MKWNKHPFSPFMNVSAWYEMGSSIHLILAFLSSTHYKIGGSTWYRLGTSIILAIYTGCARRKRFRTSSKFSPSLSNGSTWYEMGTLWPKTTHCLFQDLSVEEYVNTVAAWILELWLGRQLCQGPECQYDRIRLCHWSLNTDTLWWILSMIYNACT